MYSNITQLDVSTPKYQLTNISFIYDGTDYLIQAASGKNLDKIIEALESNIEFKTLQRKLIMAGERLYAVYNGNMILK